MFIEIQTFRLPPDTTDDAFLAEDARIQVDLMLNAPGFIRRTTARGEDGEWLVLTFWGTPDQAQGALPYATVSGYTDIGG
jgi:heme-degrading monooxygenase HmoA